MFPAQILQMQQRKIQTRELIQAMNPLLGYQERRNMDMERVNNNSSNTQQQVVMERISHQERLLEPIPNIKVFYLVIMETDERVRPYSKQFKLTLCICAFIMMIYHHIFIINCIDFHHV